MNGVIENANRTFQANRTFIKNQEKKKFHHRIGSKPFGCYLVVILNKCHKFEWFCAISRIQVSIKCDSLRFVLFVIFFCSFSNAFIHFFFFHSVRVVLFVIAVCIMNTIVVQWSLICDLCEIETTNFMKISCYAMSTALTLNIAVAFFIRLFVLLLLLLLLILNVVGARTQLKLKFRNRKHGEYSIHLARLKWTKLNNKIHDNRPNGSVDKDLLHDKICFLCDSHIIYIFVVLL